MATKEKESQITLSLTADQAYTLQILLGYVVEDAEVNDIIDQLEAATEEEVGMEDYDRVSFIVSDEDDSFQVCKEHEVQIKIN